MWCACWEVKKPKSSALDVQVFALVRLGVQSCCLPFEGFGVCDLLYTDLLAKMPLKRQAAILA